MDFSSGFSSFSFIFHHLGSIFHLSLSRNSCLWGFSNRPKDTQKFIILNTRAFQQVGWGMEWGRLRKRKEKRKKDDEESSLNLEVLKIGRRGFTITNELWGSFLCTRHLRWFFGNFLLLYSVVISLMLNMNVVGVFAFPFLHFFIFIFWRDTSYMEVIWISFWTFMGFWIFRFWDEQKSKLTKVSKMKGTR